MEWNELMSWLCNKLPDANVIAALAGAASAMAAAWTIWSSSKARANERLLGHAVTTLERAFAALVDRSLADSLPPADRIGWLTAARLIEDYKSVKSRIRDPIILLECESHEDHWAHQFYLRLEPLSIGQVEYYYSGQDPIDPTSAIIVHAFASWPARRVDPLKKFHSLKEAYDQLGIHPRWHSLQWYVNSQ